MAQIRRVAVLTVADVFDHNEAFTAGVFPTGLRNALLCVYIYFVSLRASIEQQTWTYHNDLKTCRCYGTSCY